MQICIGGSYRVVKNRNTYYGSCNDIKALEGKVVTVTTIFDYGEIEDPYEIVDEVGEFHVCESCNLEQLNNNKGR